MTKQESDATLGPRDRPANLPSEDVIEVTPQMVEAGLEVYRRWLPDDAPRSLSEAELVSDVFRAMLSRAG